MSKTKKVERIDRYDVEELACKIVGLDYDEIDADEQVIEDKMIDLYGCDLDQFASIIDKLLPMIDVGSSPITKERYKGFSDTEKQMWFVKMKINKSKP
jgi:hypothetical protein